MPQASRKKPKNRRYRGAKISEYRLRRVVHCFARDMTAKDAAIETKLSRPTVESIYWRLRERLSEHPLVRLIPSGEPSPAMRMIVNRKTAGVTEAAHPLHEMAILTRILNEQHFAGFEELSAANPDHVAKATRLMRIKFNDGRHRYHIHERLKPEQGEPSPCTRPFNPLSFDPSSSIIVNEVRVDPYQAHFEYIWRLLLKHPL